MTVAELIKELEKIEDKGKLVYTDDYEYGHYVVSEVEYDEALSYYIIR